MQKRKSKKWKMYLYYNGILIKKLKIDENEEPTKNTYAITVWFKKQLFSSNKVGLVVKPVLLLKNDDGRRETYWGVVLEQGTPI